MKRKKITPIKIFSTTRSKLKSSKQGRETYDDLINRRMFPKKKRR